MTTHFLMVYSVLCFSIDRGLKIYRNDYCSSGVRPIKYLEPFAKSVGADAVAVFKIKPKAQ